MINYSDPLDGVFKSLSDMTRRSIIEQLSRGEATLGALAQPLQISLPAVHRHIGVLEDAGLVVCEKRGRERWCRLDPRGFERVERWILGRRRRWAERLAALDEHLIHAAGNKS